MKKKISASLKLKVAIEALKGDMTIGEIASKYEVSPSEIHRCKRQLLQEGTRVFEGEKSSKTAHDNEIQKLHANIGRLTVECDFLSRALGRVK
jgi:transposase